MAGWQVTLAVLVGLPGLLLGAVLLARGPRVIGILLMAMGVLPFALLSPDPTSPTGPAPHGMALVAAVASVAGWVWLYVPPALLAAYVPDGRLGGRWWVLPAGWAVFLITFHVGIALDPGSYGAGDEQIPGAPPVVVPIWVNAVLGLSSFVLLLALLAGSAVRVLVRFRRGDEVVRRQLKWFLMSILLLPAVLVATWAAFLMTDVADVVVVAGLLLVYVSVPIGVSIGIWRHNLFDIDTLVSRTVAYTLLTGVLVAVYALVTVAAGAALGQGSAAVVAMATLACAALFSLLRRRFQAAVDARFDRGRREALTQIDRFLDDIRDGRAEPEQVESALRQALRDPGLCVIYRLPSGSANGWQTSEGSPTADPEEPYVEIAPGGSVLARVTFGRAARRPRLLHEVLRRAHLPLELAHSRMMLRQTLAEIRASRARILEAADVERRRIERDLHDGAQQRLVAIGMSLQLARNRTISSDPVQRVLDAAIHDLQEAVVELRQLAGGVRPRSLDEGLPAAIRSLVRNSPIPVSVQVTTEPVEEGVATTAYYVAAEALTNALKHGDPTTVAIAITRCAENVRIVVSDDGCGGAVVHAGSGLAGLRDRVAATGGELVVDSDHGGGTRVEARLPCGS